MIDEDSLRARYSLVEIDEEGVLLDRVSGAVFRVNRTACAIWRALLAGDSLPAIAAMMARRFGIAQSIAERDARMALDDERSSHLTEGSGRTESIDYRWQESPTGYVFLEHGIVTCEVDGRGNTLILPPGTRPTTSDARTRIRSVVSRILTLRGIHLLHASAVEFEGALTVFSGPSGAGKTTTARAFARIGGRLISEDLLVLSPSSNTCRVLAEGETTIRKWVADKAARLAERPDEAVPCAGLDQCIEGETLPLSQILLVDANRRSGDRISSEILSRPDALVALMESAYFASPDPSSWDALFAVLRRLAVEVTISRAVMPSGLAYLEKAVESFDQKRMIAS